MTYKQIVIKDYFNIMRDENGRIFCIQEFGDPKSLIKAIREQNEYIQAKEQECEKLHKQLKQAEQKLAEKDKEIERLKQGIKHYQRGMFSIINTATECRNNKKWNYK